MLEQYAFRGIQFGNWVEDAAGRYHVLCSGNALADLAAILEIPRKSVALYGALGLAFGTRGSGAAVAHYEPSTNVMNITKIRGGVAFCHEWAHAWILTSTRSRITMRMVGAQLFPVTSRQFFTL